MNRIINVFCGPPNSGKSTGIRRCMEAFSSLNGTIVLSKRQIYQTLTGKELYIQDDASRLVDSIHDVTLEKALDKGIEVYLEDYNCNYSKLLKDLAYWKTLGKVNFTFMDRATLDELKQRLPLHPMMSDAKLQKYINDYEDILANEDVLESMAEFNVSIDEKLIYNENLPECVLIDIDDTIAFHTPEVRGPFEWDKVSKDAPIKDMVRLINSMDPTVVRIFITGRDQSCVNDTEEWIEEHFIFNNNSEIYEPHLLMRKTGDFRSAAIIKHENLLNHVVGKYNIIGAFDDDPRVLEMYQRFGINTMMVKGLMRNGN